MRINGPGIGCNRRQALNTAKKELFTMSASTLPVSGQTAQFNKSSQRIGAVAWRWNRQYPGHVAYRAKYETGASDREIDLGFELGQLMSEEYARLRCWYGDPAYGS